MELCCSGKARSRCRKRLPGMQPGWTYPGSQDCWLRSPLLPGCRRRIRSECAALNNLSPVAFKEKEGFLFVTGKINRPANVKTEIVEDQLRLGFVYRVLKKSPASSAVLRLNSKASPWKCEVPLFSSSWMWAPEPNPTSVPALLLSTRNS